LWLGGTQIIFQTQSGFKERFLPSLNVGKTLATQGGCSGDCTTGGTLNLAWMNATARTAVLSTSNPGGYYVVGNEVNDVYSDDAAPTQAAYGAQLDAWVAAIRQYDPLAHFVGPNFTSWEGVSCGSGPSGCYPWGEPKRWWSQFLVAYRAAHLGAQPPFSVMSVHVYPPCNADAPADTTGVDDFSRQVASDGFPAKVWVTEAALCFDQPISQSLSSDQEQQLSAFVDAYRSDPRVGRFYYLTLPYPGTLPFRSLFYADGGPTEVASTLANASR
jgi:hypothetical protein